MNKRECCRAVFSALEGAQDESGVALEISEITKKRLEIVCSVIGEMSADAGVEIAQIMVSRAGLTIVLECDDELLLENGNTHPFFSLIGKVDKFSFSKAKVDRLRITLTMDRLWVN